MKKTILTTTALIFVASLSAASAAGRGGMNLDFSTIDADGDGQITQAEVTAFEAASFASADTDGNGSLSKEELIAQIEARIDTNQSDRMANRVDRMISNLDTDGDGSISLEERQSDERSARIFDRLDKDDDGTISSEEAETASDRGGRDGKRGGGKGGHGKGGHGKGGRG